MKTVLVILIAIIVAVVFVLPHVDLDPTIVKLSQLLWAFWIFVFALIQQRSAQLTINTVQALRPQYPKTIPISAPVSTSALLC